MDRTPQLTRSQLFLDDLWIDEQHKLTRRWHPANIYPDPLTLDDRPWDGSAETVMRIGDRWRMYYGGSSFRVAESDDGIHWTRPSLGLVESDGGKRNNLLPAAPCKGQRSVCHDPDDDEAPFKMIYLGRGGIRGATSRDGYRWTELDRPLISKPPASDVQYLWFNKTDGRYVIMHKTIAGRSRRAQCITESEDFRSFPESRLILKADLVDPPDVEYYGITGFEYADLYLGMAQRWFNEPDRTEVMLMWSHDRRTWHRPYPREPFIGPAYVWNRGASRTVSSPPWQVGNQLWLHFNGSGRHHEGIHSYVKAGPRTNSYVGLAMITVDRFASLTAGFMEGQLVTRPMTWPGGDLLLNASTTRHRHSYPKDGGGAMKLEVWDESAQPLEGFAGQSAAPFDGNVPARGLIDPAVLRWPGDRSLDELTGRRIRLNFLMRDAHLFSFRSSGTRMT